MPSKLRPYFDRELELFHLLMKDKEYSIAWRCLERAHIIGQPYPLAHTYIHWQMLKYGIKLKDTKEIMGQIPRLLVGGIKSFVGKIPVGNTGGANVSPLKPMPIPSELSKIISNAKK